MAALKGGAFGNQQGFAEYLRAFSRQSVNGLWLTGFTIAGSGELEIRGRVLEPGSRAELYPAAQPGSRCSRAAASRAWR